MRRHILARSCVASLTLSRQTTLADSQIAVHEIFALLLSVRIIESQLVTHLMLDCGQQIDMTGRSLRRVSVQASRRKCAIKVAIRERIRIDEPATASSIAVNQDAITLRFAKIRIW